MLCFRISVFLSPLEKFFKWNNIDNSNAGTSLRVPTFRGISTSFLEPDISANSGIEALEGSQNITPSSSSKLETN